MHTSNLLFAFCFWTAVATALISVKICWYIESSKAGAGEALLVKHRDPSLIPRTCVLKAGRMDR